MKRLFVPTDSPPTPAGEFLQAQFPDLAPGYLAQLLKRGKFRTDSGIDRETLLNPGDVILLPGNQAFQQQIASCSPAILFEDDATLLVNKPSRLAVHRGVGHEGDNLMARLEKTMRLRRVPYRLHPVHRLDKETSGCLLLAKGKRAAGAYGTELMERDIQKSYLALVSGELPDRGEISTPLAQRGRLRASETRYRTLARGKGFSLLEIELLSGRTHQIRRHLAATGNPLAGDRRYGGDTSLERFFLHCRRLSFRSPASGESVSICAPLPEEKRELLLQLEFFSPEELPELE